MGSIEKKHLEQAYELQAAEAVMKWYGWGSPIGLGIWLLILVIIAAIIKIVFFG